jgi:hypothetical protein
MVFNRGEVLQQKNLKKMRVVGFSALAASAISQVKHRGAFSLPDSNLHGFSILRPDPP